MSSWQTWLKLLQKFLKIIISGDFDVSICNALKTLPTISSPMCFRQAHHNNDLFNLFCSYTQIPDQRPVFVDVVSNNMLVAPSIVQFHSISRLYVKSPMMLPTDCSAPRQKDGTPRSLVLEPLETRTSIISILLYLS